MTSGSRYRNGLFFLRNAVPKIVAGKKVKPPARLSGRTFTEKTAAPFLGHYVRDDGIHTTLTVQKGFLTTGRGGMLLPIAKDKFFSPTYGCDVTFDMADDGKATALVYRPVGTAPIVFKKVGH